MSGRQASGFVWYELMTTDLDAAVAFYGPVVGWEIRDSGMPGMRYMIFGKDGRDVGGMVAWSSMGQHKPAGWKGHIHTDEVDAETEAVVADGGVEFRPPTDIPGVGRFSVVGDPQGAEYLLFQPNQAGAPPRLAPQELGAVGWHELLCSDLDSAWRFYHKHYGWSLDAAHDMGSMGVYQTFIMGASAGGMMTMPPFLAEKGAKPAWLFYFTVNDIKAAAQRVTENGGAVTHGPAPVPGGAWILQGTDPQGGAFALTAAG